jgi:hypothetical protein
LEDKGGRYLDLAWWSDMPNKVYKTSAHYERLTIEAARTVYWRVRRPSVPPPVILVGCSRAGTTVVHDTIAHSRALKAFRYEPRYFWQGLFDPAQRGWMSDGATAEDATPEVRRKVHEFYFKKLGGGRFLEKTCINGFKIPLLDALWPDAYFVHLHRDGRDNISSLINGWRRYEQFALYELPVDTHIEGIPERTWCFFLEPGWRDALGRPLEEVCAHQWVAINEAILASRELVPPERWIELRYEDIFTRPVEMFREVFERVDLPFNAEMHAYCRSLASHGVSLIGSAPAPGKWHRQNPEAIERILPIIAPTMSKLGYEL